MSFGPDLALRVVESLSSEPALRRYHLLPAVRGDLLAKLGRDDEARAEFKRAASLTQNARQRAALEARAAGHSTSAKSESPRRNEACLPIGLTGPYLHQT